MGVFRRIFPLLLTAFMLASCSINPFAKAKAKTSSAPLPLLCRSIPSLSKLMVVRTDSLPQNHLKFTLPTKVTVSNQTQVQDVAEALCSLPLAPSNVSTNCPADLGVTYHLAFSSKDEYFPLVGIDAAGCQSVHGLMKGQWAIHSPGFWHTLGTALGIKIGTYTFSGKPPNIG